MGICKRFFPNERTLPTWLSTNFFKIKVTIDKKQTISKKI